MKRAEVPTTDEVAWTLRGGHAHYCKLQPDDVRAAERPVHDYKLSIPVPPKLGSTNQFKGSIRKGIYIKRGCDHRSLPSNLSTQLSDAFVKKNSKGSLSNDESDGVVYDDVLDSHRTAIGCLNHSRVCQSAAEVSISNVSPSTFPSMPPRLMISIKLRPQLPAG